MGGFQGIPNYTIAVNTEVSLWEGAVYNYNNAKVTVGPPSTVGQTCVSVGGCASTYFAYPVPGILYTDTVRIADHGMNAANGTCCTFQRITSIAKSDGFLQVGPSPAPGVPTQWKFGQVQWVKSYTEHYNSAATPPPSPGATPNDDIPDGNGTTSGWKLGIASNLGGDSAGYTDYPRCSAYLSINYQNNQIETDTVYMPAAYPNLPCTQP